MTRHYDQHSTLPIRSAGTSTAVRAMPALLLALLATSACHKAPAPAADNGQATSESRPAAATADTAAAKPDLGPALLSTVGLYETPPVTDIQAKQGRFEIRPGTEAKQLFVNGVPWTYSSGPGVPPSPIEANDDIRLVGVLELPRESVAWVLITGGTACAGTHVLVSIRDGKPLVGSAIPGCDDRGTLRRVDDDHLVFDAGGSTGTYRAGELKVDSAASGDGQ